MPKVLNQDVTINWRNYGDITIPAGTRVTNKTACGVDPAYNFVDQFEWMHKNYPDTASIMLHDATYYGINIPAEFIKEI